MYEDNLPLKVVKENNIFDSNTLTESEQPGKNIEAEGLAKSNPDQFLKTIGLDRYFRNETIEAKNVHSFLIAALSSKFGKTSQTYFRYFFDIENSTRNEREITIPIVVYTCKDGRKVNAAPDYYVKKIINSILYAGANASSKKIKWNKDNKIICSYGTNTPGKVSIRIFD